MNDKGKVWPVVIVVWSSSHYTNGRHSKRRPPRMKGETERRERIEAGVRTEQEDAICVFASHVSTAAIEEG